MLSPVTTTTGSWQTSVTRTTKHVAADRKLTPKFRERKSLRLTLKHLRQRGLLGPFESLLASVTAPPMSLHFEHPLLSLLHRTLVVEGNFAVTEALLSRAALAPSTSSNPDDDHAHDGPSLFQPYVDASIPRPVWTRIDVDPAVTSRDGEAPGPRGGHQLVYCAPDPIRGGSGAILLFGGWDGSRDLADLWRFDLPLRGSSSLGRWSLVSADTRREGGPGPSSCHKCCVDERTGDLYVLGRYHTQLDTATQGSSADTPTQSPRADFYRFRTRGTQAGTWELISEDTSVRSSCVRC